MLVPRNKNQLPQIVISIIGGLAMLGTMAAHAQTVTVTGLAQNPLPVTVGHEAFFSGTLTNTDAANPVTLGALSVDFTGNNGSDGSYMTQDLNDDYANNVLDTLTLAPAGQSGASYSGELFGIMTYAAQPDPTAATPPGTYDEAFTLSDVNGDALAVSSLTVAVAAPAPEPAPPLTLAVGTAVMAFLASRRLVTKSP